MTVNLNLAPQSEDQIKTLAERHNLTPDDYLLALIESALPKEVEPAELVGKSDEDFIAAMRSLSRTPAPDHLRNCTWTRAEIYQDHD